MRTNVAVKTPVPVTHEGAKAARIGAVQQLRRSVMACMLWEDGFYELGVDIAQRIRDEVVEVLKLKDGASIVANIAYEARTKFKLRHAPLWLTVALIQAQTDLARAVVSGVIAAVVQRPDELSELVAMYWKNGKVALTAQMKKGLAAAFQKFDRYSLSKYANRDGQVKMRDVLFLVHAKPKDDEQAALWKELAAGELTAPDTWEASLSAGADKKGTFERLIAEGKLGALALLRNLRNMQQAGVKDTTIREALKTMDTERVLPFRYITAARYAPTLEPELEAAMFRSLEDQPKLLGKTILCVDNSPSMYGETVSAKSELQRVDAACALAMLLREVCEEVVILAFSTNFTVVPPRRGFALRDAIQKTEKNGTHIGRVVAEAQRLGFDRLIIITDEQSQDGVPASPGGNGYMLNVANNQNGVGYGAWTHIDGWSEALVEYIRQFEAQP